MAIEIRTDPNPPQEFYASYFVGSEADPKRYQVFVKTNERVHVSMRLFDTQQVFSYSFPSPKKEDIDSIVRALFLSPLSNLLEKSDSISLDSLERMVKSEQSPAA